MIQWLRFSTWIRRFKNPLGTQSGFGIQPCQKAYGDLRVEIVSYAVVALVSEAEPFSMAKS